MKKMTADLFKAIAFLITDAVHAGRESVVTTKHGRPVAKLISMLASSIPLAKRFANP
jgi:antitoxin (DNA-binding transcriptional repressor) of toxin-antitoxin stability system